MKSFMVTDTVIMLMKSKKTGESRSMMFMKQEIKYYTY
jgi:hypothetical protein